MKIVFNKTIFMKIALVVIVVLLCVGGLNTSTLIKNDNNKTNFQFFNSLSAEAMEGQYLIVGLNDESIRFLNQVHGYGVVLPSTMKVTETSLTEYRIVLEDDNRQIEIYKQPITEKNISSDTYISYSNGFLKNTVDHKLELKRKVKINGYDTVITLWSRSKLKNVEDDKNYYTCIDIISTDYVYTFFIKSNMSLEEEKNIMELVESFDTFNPTSKPIPIKLKQTENKSWNEETSEFYNKYFIEEGNMSWGIFKYSAPQDMTELKEIESKIDYEFNFLLVYKHVHKEYPSEYVKKTLDSAYANGRTVELTLQTTSQDEGEGNMVYDILDGKYDSFLYSFAKETADFGHPVLFRLCNEMNGDWCTYSAYHTSRDTEIYIELYKYIYKIFEEVKADNVIWIWNPNERSFPDFDWNNELLYYPGDEYVDIVGLTGYNTGTYYKDEIWRSFKEIYDPIYEKAAKISDKPLMITEFSSSKVGGNKENWVKDMFVNLKKYPRIKLAIWWDGCDWDADGNIARSYFINDSGELLNIFKKELKNFK